MKPNKFLFLLVLIICIFGCKSSIKQQSDSVYSRHLQRHVPLTIITTPMPNKKEEMNLLLFNNNSLAESTRAKKIIDSLYKLKQIQPLMLVAFDGKQEDYGLEEDDSKLSKEYKQYNKFIDDELYPFVKKKAVIRKFNSVAVCGFMDASLSAFDVAFNDDNKFQLVGMFSPLFAYGDNDNASTLQIIQSLKKRPTIKLYVEDSGLDSSAIKFQQIMASKQSITECKLIPQETGDVVLKKMPTIRNFAAFLLWAFPR